MNKTHASAYFRFTLMIMKKTTTIRNICVFSGLCSLFYTSAFSQTLFQVDVNNAVIDGQGGSLEQLGAGITNPAGSQDLESPDGYFIADGFIAGESYGGSFNQPGKGYTDGGTIDIIATGGTMNYESGSPRYFGKGLSSRVGDSNDLYLGMVSIDFNYNGDHYWTQETATYATSFQVTERGSYAISFDWSHIGIDNLGQFASFVADPVGTQAGVIFYIDSDTDYANGGIVASTTTDLATYNGEGTQVWNTHNVTLTLDPGTYYWGVTPTVSQNQLNYVAVDGITITQVPEVASCAFLGLSSMALLFSRRR